MVEFLKAGCAGVCLRSEENSSIDFCQYFSIGLLDFDIQLYSKFLTTA